MVVMVAVEKYSSENSQNFSVQIISPEMNFRGKIKKMKTFRCTFEILICHIYCRTEMAYNHSFRFKHAN